MKPLASLSLALLLAGCGGQAAEIPEGWLSIIEAEAAVPPATPAECQTAGDPKWVDPPDRDVLRDEAVRRDRQNKNNFNILRGKRRVCAAGLANNVEAANAQR